MIKKSFTKPPLSLEEKEKKAEEFISMVSISRPKDVSEDKKENNRITSKDRSIPFLLRIPLGTYEDLIEIKNITGLSINSICIEMLRGAAKIKLKELKE